MHLLNSQSICILLMLSLFISCSDQSVAIEKEARLKLEKKLKLAENTVKVLGQSSSGVDLSNENLDSLSRNVIKSLSLSSYEVRKAYLVGEECLNKKRKENNTMLEKHAQDSVYHALLKQTVLHIDSTSLKREADPTIQELLIDIEKLNVLKKEFDKFCQ